MRIEFMACCESYFRSVREMKLLPDIPIIRMTFSSISKINVWMTNSEPIRFNAKANYTQSKVRSCAPNILAGLFYI